MGGTTPAPWSIPYPTGTDRVADGDNAMQALAERVAAIVHQLPRGLVMHHYAAGSWTIGDEVPITLNPYVVTEQRDLLITIDFMWAAVSAGSGFYGQLRDNGVTILQFDTSQAQPSLRKWSWSFRVPAIVVGSHSYSFRLAAWAANGSIMSNPTMAVWDMGASSTI